ncbi:hypothetical protein [Myceligenerans crystallogenes]|uniref:Abi family protein n=1 Tax=Myceligenerans crystallogenes TaxID=316335 RepID=A0ABN2NI03_9MICO
MSIYAPVRTTMLNLLSSPRLSTYSGACAGDLDRAVALYRWNLNASLAMFSSIHYFEVALRNTMHDALTRHFGTRSMAWYERPGLLSPGSLSKIRQAESAVRANGHTVTVDRVVAELPLGFWCSLLANSYNRSLWQPCLSQVFRNTRRQRLFDEIDAIRKLRNRIAHWEPVIALDLTAEYTRIVDTAERINHRLAWWIDATSTIGAVLEQRP